MMEPMAPRKLGSQSRSVQRRRPGGRWGQRRWSAGLITLLVAAGAAIGLVLVAGQMESSGRPTGAAAAAIGDNRFSHAEAHCHLTAAANRRRGQSSLLLGMHISLRLFVARGRCEEARLAQETGVQPIREDFSWALSEPQPNRYRWANDDGIVRAATQAGLTLLPVLDDAPPWGAPTGTSLPSNPGAYAAFVAAVVARYGRGGSFWRAHPRLPARPLVWYELWNEPYNAASNRDPAVYAHLVQAAVTAGRAASPSARFLMEAATVYQTVAGDRAPWLSAMYAAVPDLGHYFDGLAVHPYGGNPAIYTPRGVTDSQPGRIQQMHSELAAHGDGAKPLWVTEIGWSTCTGTSGCVSEAQQASYLRTFLKLCRTRWRSYVRAVFVYELRDLARHPPDDIEAWYGLLRPDLSRKPAWQVLHNAATSAS